MGANTGLPPPPPWPPEFLLIMDAELVRAHDLGEQLGWPHHNQKKADDWSKKLVALRESGAKPIEIARATRWSRYWTVKVEEDRQFIAKLRQRVKDAGIDI